MRILLTGGGSGGHLFPLIAIARQIKKSAPDAEFLFIGPDTLTMNILNDENIPCQFIFAGKLRRYASFNFIFDFFGFIIGFFQALWHILIFMPDVTFSKGGYGGLSSSIVSWLYRIPLIIHESDSIPGLSNKISSRFAKRISISFAETEKYFPVAKTALMGNPVREEILNGSKNEAKTIFNLTLTRPTLLVIGGSQGAEAINEFIYFMLPRLLNKYEIIHQCGANNYENAKKNTSENPYYHLLPFLNETQIKHAYAASDLIISRAGAGSITEISANAKPSIIIPLPSSASDHQKANAYAYAKTGATSVLEQANLTPNIFEDEIDHLLSSPELLAKMSASAKNFYHPDAAEKIANEIIQLGTR